LNRCINFASKKQLDLWTGSSKSKSRGRHAQSRYDEFRLQLEIRETMEIGLAGKHDYGGNALQEQRATIGARQIVACGARAIVRILRRDTPTAFTETLQDSAGRS
jgi:hypothetical protein